MKFSKEHLVDIESLNEVEGAVFIRFLLLERERHIETAERCGTWCELWLSELTRQMEEVRHIDSGIAGVKKKFKMEEK